MKRMMTNQLESVRLMERDLNMLKDLSLLGAMSFSQISSRHFENADASTVCNRLTKLVNAGLVTRFRVGSQQYQGKAKTIGVIYQITRRGLSKIRNFFPEVPFRDEPVPLNTASLAHDLLLTDVMRELERRFEGAKVIHGNQLKRQSLDGVRAPDAIIEYLSGKKIAVELELTVKSKRRYRHIVTNYRLLPEYEQVLYIVANQAIQTTIEGEILGYKPRKGEQKPSTGKFKFLKLQTLNLENQTMKKELRSEMKAHHDENKNHLTEEVNECHYQ